MREEHSGFREFYTSLSGYETKVKTAEQFMRAVDNAFGILCDAISDENIKYSQKLWFRGIRAYDYPLLPAIGRNNLNVEYEATYLSKFKSKALLYLDQIPFSKISEENGSYWEWLFLMHHYGVPTRILNWTEDAIVALIFAVDMDASDEEKQKDAAVWCLNPVMLNTSFNFHEYYPSGYIPNVRERGVYDIFGPNMGSFRNNRPAAVYGPVNSTKIIMQRNTYTVFPYTVPLTDMRDLPDSRKYLFRITIDKESREYITDQLRRYGITKEKLMPELDTVAREIFKE